MRSLICVPSLLCTLRLSWFKLPVMPCVDYNSSFLTVIFALSLPSILLPELPDNIQHVISDTDPKMTLKNPHTHRLRSKLLFCHSQHTRSQNFFPDLCPTPVPHTLGSNYFEPSLVLDHVLYLPLCLGMHHSLISCHSLEIRCSL